MLTIILENCHFLVYVHQKEDSVMVSFGDPPIDITIFQLGISNQSGTMLIKMLHRIYICIYFYTIKWIFSCTEEEISTIITTFHLCSNYLNSMVNIFIEYSEIFTIQIRIQEKQYKMLNKKGLNCKNYEARKDFNSCMKTFFTHFLSNETNCTLPGKYGGLKD